MHTDFIPCSYKQHCTACPPRNPLGSSWAKTLYLSSWFAYRVLLWYFAAGIHSSFPTPQSMDSLSLLFSIYNATLIARPCILSVISRLVMVSYTGAKTGLSFGILQWGIRRVLLVVVGFVMRLKMWLWTWKKISNEDCCFVIPGGTR